MRNGGYATLHTSGTELESKRGAVTLDEARRAAKAALPDLEDVATTPALSPHELSRDEFPLPDLILFGLTRLCDLRQYGPAEKLRWGVRGKYQGTTFSITLEKFGLRLYVVSHASVEERASIIGCLRTAVRLAEAHVRTLAQDQVDAGNVTIENQYRFFEGAYRFFRYKAKRAYRTKPPKAKVLRHSPDGHVVSWSSQPFKPLIEGGYYAGAMLDAYFSRLEHSLVLALAFTRFDPREGRLLQFVSANWDEKLRSIFDFGEDDVARKIYEDVRKLKEELRNPLAHGGFAKKGASFNFHVERFGALPVLLSGHGRTVDTFFTRMPEVSYTRACAQFDAFDTFLDQSSIRHGLQFSRSSMNVSFSEESRQEYQRVIAAGNDAFEEFISHRVDEADRHMNMDY
jgi:hypothetical protein